MRTFIDTTPLKVANVPEMRTYTYWPVVNDGQIGSPSMMVQVTASQAGPGPVLDYGLEQCG